MGLFERYISRYILMSTVLVMLVIISLDTLFGFLGAFKYAARYESYTYAQAMLHVALGIPGKIIEMLPAGTMIGSLLGLGMLSSNSELTAMRAAGISRGRIIWGGMKTGLLIGLFMLFLGQFVTPRTEVLAESYKAYRLVSGLKSEVRDLWAKYKDRIFHIDLVSLEGAYSVKGVRVFEVEDNQLQAVTAIDSAQYQQGQGWTFDGERRTEYAADKIQTVNDAKLHGDDFFDVDVFKLASVKPNNMDLLGLNYYIDYLQDNDMESAAYRRAFWKKITGPLSILVMMLLAMPFVFGNSRAGNAGARIVIGILFGMAYYIFSEMVGNVGQVYDVPVLISAFSPLLAFSLLGVVLLQRSQ